MLLVEIVDEVYLPLVRGRGIHTIGLIPLRAYHSPRPIDVARFCCYL
jgi:hypothetical protein